jgi:hypothetical protein
MKLGFSLQLVTVRWAGAFLEDPLDVPVVVLDFVAEQLGIADPSGVKKYNGVLGQCGCRGPKTVDRLLGRRKALGGQRDQVGHGRRHLGEC